MQAILFPEQHRAGVGDAPGELALRAHGHGVAVRGHPVVDVEVGRVAQGAGVDGLALRAPDAVIALADARQVRHLPLQHHRPGLHAGLGEDVLGEGQLPRLQGADDVAAVVRGAGRTAGDFDCVSGLEKLVEAWVFVQRRRVQQIGDLVGPVALLCAALHHHVLLGAVAVVLNVIARLELVRGPCGPAAHSQCSRGLVHAGPGVGGDGCVGGHAALGLCVFRRLVDVALLRHGQGVGREGHVAGEAGVFRRQHPKLLCLRVVVDLIGENDDFGVDGGKLLFARSHMAHHLAVIEKVGPVHHAQLPPCVQPRGAGVGPGGLAPVPLTEAREAGGGEAPALCQLAVPGPLAVVQPGKGDDLLAVLAGRRRHVWQVHLAPPPKIDPSDPRRRWAGACGDTVSAIRPAPRCTPGRSCCSCRPPGCRSPPCS